MNRMAEVAKMLGVELDEKFMIDGLAGNFRINKNGVIEMEYIDGTWQTARITCLQHLLTGVDVIKKKPFKPKEFGTVYWAVTPNGEKICLTYFSENNLLNAMSIAIGNCFEKEEDITPDIINKYVDVLNGTTQLEV